MFSACSPARSGRQRLSNCSVTHSRHSTDADGSGKLAVGEIQALVKDMGLVVGEDEVELIADAISSGEDGSEVSFMAFLAWSREHELRTAFANHAGEGGAACGELRVEALPALLHDLGRTMAGDAELQRVVAQLDPGGDGAVTFAAFVTWWSVLDAKLVFEK